MDRSNRPERDRDNYRHRDNHRDRDRDRDRDLHHQPRRPSRFSDGPPPPDHRPIPRGVLQSDASLPPDHRRSPRGGFFSGGPPRSSRGGFSARGPRGGLSLGGGAFEVPREGFSAGGPPRSPRGGFSAGGLGFSAGGPTSSPRGGLSSGRPPRSPRGGFSACGPTPGGFSAGGPPRGGNSFGGRAFDSPPRQPQSVPIGDNLQVPSGPTEELFPPMHGNAGGPGNGVIGGTFGVNYPPQQPPLKHFPPINTHPFQRPPLQHSSPVNHQLPPLLGQKRGFPFLSHASDSSPEHNDGGSFVKLFVGSVPKTTTVDEIRPLFDEQGTVLEVAFIKDKKTGQQQGCCFIKYATSEEADRAIKALHNQYTLPGGVGPIQVRYADGERERIGNVEYKLFVGALNKYATEKEVEEIFASYGCVEDVYLMRDERNQSRGCGFVKFSNKESAMAAVNALNGTHTMRGCDQPLTVRFADSKRPRAGEPRAGPAFGGPGFGLQSPGVRPAPGPFFPDNKGGQCPATAYQPWSPPNLGPSPNAGIHGFGNQFPPMSEDALNSSIPGGHSGGAQGGSREGSLAGFVPASSTSSQNFDQSFPQVLPCGQQISPLQKSLKSPPQFAPALQLHQGPGSYSQVRTSQTSLRPPSQQQSDPYSQPFQSEQAQSLYGQPPHAQIQDPKSATSTTVQSQLNTGSSIINTHLTTSAPQQPLPPFQQSPSQLAQILSQQTQTLQASFQSSHQAISQLQQQVQMMQPSLQNQTLQQCFQASKQQSQWPGAVPTTVPGSPYATQTSDVPPATSSALSGSAVAAKTAQAKCNWTEHTSPAGHKYYYNSATGESTWQKPNELKLYEEAHKSVGQPQPPPQFNPNLRANPVQQVTQSQLPPLQTQFRSVDHLQHPPLSSTYPAPQGPGYQTAQEKTYSQSPAPEDSANDTARFQQGFPAAQNWAWNNGGGN